MREKYLVRRADSGPGVVGVSYDSRTQRFTIGGPKRFRALLKAVESAFEEPPEVSPESVVWISDGWRLVGRRGLSKVGWKNGVEYLGTAYLLEKVQSFRRLLR